MRELRVRAADRMMIEVVGYLMAEVFPHLNLSDEGVWQGVDPPDRELVAALAAYERGEITFEDLEDAGTRYVEAWQALAGG